MKNVFVLFILIALNAMLSAQADIEIENESALMSMKSTDTDNGSLIILSNSQI